MRAMELPLELQQHVFSCLDTRSFHAARNACRWWRFASSDRVTLWKQLEKLPICPSMNLAGTSPLALQRLFNEAAHVLMLGVEIHRQPDAPGSHSAASKVTSMTLPGSSTAQGHTLNYELALSTNGKSFAIAQERTTRAYTSQSGSCPSQRYVSRAAGSLICGLEFKTDDRVFRVHLSTKCLYLATPWTTADEVPDIDRCHWESQAGLDHVFLDTSLITLGTAARPGDETVRLSGLQLLRRGRSGFIFAAQHRGGSESGHYILGHVKCSIPRTGHTIPVEPGSVTVLARLESLLSAWSYNLNGVQESGMGLYENMPRVHEYSPRFAISPDGSFLVVAEQDNNTVRHVPLTQLFLYRLPRKSHWSVILEDQRNKSRGLDDDLRRRDIGLRPSVARIPRCLTTFMGAVTKLSFETADTNAGQQMFTLAASTAESTRQWGIQEMC